MKEKIGITACSDPMKPEFQSNMDRLCAILSDVGYEPVISNCIYPKIYPEAYGLHGTGAERAAELMKLYTDPEITVHWTYPVGICPMNCCLIWILK